MSSTMEQPSKQKSHRHVAVIAFPFSSHPGALFGLARAMAARAPDVTFSFLSSPESISSLSKIPGKTENLRLCHVDMGSPADVPVLQRIGMFLKAAPGNLRAGVEATGELVTCVVSDAFLWMASEVADEMGVPWVAAWTGSVSALIAHLYTDRLRQAYGVVVKDDAAAAGHPKADQSLDIIPCLSDFKVRDLPEGILSDVDSPFSLLLHRVAKQLPRAAAIAVNTMQGLDPTIDTELTSAFKKYLPVGPLDLLSPPPTPQHEVNADDDNNEGCITWLDRQNPSSVAYVSFGTITSLPPSELAELALGLEASGMPFLWSLKNKEPLPVGFLERIKGKGLVLDWVPQARVLAHDAVGVFVSHCGWSSTMEAVASGVPMICRPVFADQLMSGKTVCDVWKIGFGFADGKVTREELVRALSKILIGEDEEGRMIRERSCKMKTRALLEVASGGTTTNNLNSLLEIVKA